MRRSLIGLIILFLGFSGCSKVHRDDLIRSGAISPSAQGTWAGNVTVQAQTSPLQFAITQTNIELKGTYNSPLVPTGQGKIEGRTTGPTLSIKLMADPTCPNGSFQFGGQNSGTDLSMNLTGTDCQGQPITGQTTLTKIN